MANSNPRRPTAVAVVAAVVIAAAGAFFGYRFFFSHSDAKPTSATQTTQQLSSTDTPN